MPIEHDFGFSAVEDHNLISVLQCVCYFIQKKKECISYFFFDKISITPNYLPNF